MKCKQLLSVILTLCMLASSMVAFAAPVYDANYECSSISFGYEDGKVWTDAPAIEGGKTLTGKVTAKTSGEEENMVFSMFIYKNGKMLDGEVVTLPVGSEDVEFKASVDVPDDAEGCQVVAVLWNNFYDMKMICDSALFPGTNTKLRGLYVDGALIEGFDPDVTEYNCVISAEAEKYPEISWEKVDSSAKVTYTKPSSFPGRSIVTVEGVAGEKTEYVISYVSEYGDFISNFGGSATNLEYVKGGLEVGAKAYSDRTATETAYCFTAIGDPSYKGADVILGAISWQSSSAFASTAADWITFDAARGVTVKVLKSDTAGTSHFVDDGWTLERSTLATGFVQTNTNAPKNHQIALTKHFDAGKVSIPAGGSKITYIVAIMVDPLGYEGGDEGGDEPSDPSEPEVPADKSLKLESISIDGVALEGFDADTTEYTHVLTTTQLARLSSPEVTYTLMDETSEATVSLPETFPGSVTVTVTNSEAETAEYVINYDAKNLVTNFVANGEPTSKALYVPGGLKIGGSVASDRLGQDSWAINEYVPELEGGDTILTPVDGWANVVTSFQFDLARNGTITSVHNKTNVLSTYTAAGFTANPDTTSRKLKIVNKAPDSREYMFMATKEVERGTITMPYTKPNMPALTVLHVVPWSNQATPDESTLLTDIKIDGVSIADFDKGIATYTVELTDAQLAATEAPEVTYTLADEISTVTMERPSSFPGSVVITVMGKDDATNTYTINYTADVVADLALNEAAGTEAPKPAFKKNYQLGDTTYSDRNNNFYAIQIADEYVGKDRILYGLGWKNDWAEDYYNVFIGDVIDWVTFTAKRETKVMVFEASKSTADYAGFEEEYSADAYIEAQASSNGNLNYKYKYTKTFAAGEKAALPNVDTSNRVGMVVLDYAPWGGFDAEGGDEPDEPGTPDTPVDPEEPEDSLEIMKVKDGKESIVAFVHDDGDYATASYIKDKFIENGLKGSVGLIVENITDSNKEKWQELFDTGVLNAESHSMTHTYVGQDNTKDETAIINGVETFIPAGKMETEIAGSQEKIRELFPNEKALIYIRPGVGTVTDLQGNTLTATNSNAIAMMQENYIAARVTGRTAFTKEGVDTIPPTNYFAMYSIMPTNDTTYEKMMESVDEAVAENGLLVFCFHKIEDVLTNKNSTLKTEADKVFADVGQYVEEGKVWNPFYADAVKYMKETETAKATMETTGDAIEVTVTDELDNEIFDYPLTVKVPVPADWEYALLTQGERTESNLKTFTENGEAFVYANVVPDAGKATVVKSELILDDLALTEIKIDGAKIKAFNSDTTEYTYALTPAQAESVDAPVVTYTLEDADSSAVVTNPTEFPGSVTITVTNKNSETRTYTVNYEADAVLTNITVADSTAKLPEYAANGFVVGAKPYFERPYSIQEINDESLVGKSFFKGNIEWQNNATFNSSTYTPWITLNSQRAVKVTILKTVTNGYAEMVADGFTYTTSENANGYVKADTNSPKNFKYAFTKEFEAGEVVIPNGMSKNAYFVLFSYAPWGGFDAEGGDEPVVPPVEPDEPVETALVKAIKLDGNAIAGFNAETLTYNVTLTDDQMASSSYPEVTVELNDAEASAVVTDPTSFPGFAEIKVTKGEETKTYKVTYDVPLLTVNLTSEAPQGTPGVAVVKGVNVGDKNFNDRTTFPIEAINDDTITADTLKIKTCIGWQTDQKDYATLYKGTAINDWLNFTAPRAMVVTVYEDNAVNSSKFNYWTTETSSDAPYIVATASNSLKYTTRHRRVYEAGEVVEIPNAVGNRTFAVTVNYLNWNEEAPELDVVIPIIKKISYSDLVPKVTSGENANVEPGMWNGLAIYTTTKYQLSKEFADITEPTEITLTTDKIAKGYGIIVVAPLNETEDKNVIVNPDGSDLEWEDYDGVVIDYNYTNGGNEDFDPANATFVQRNNTAVTFSGGNAYVYSAMNNSDDIYITGSALASTRNPYTGELHWTDLPEEYLGCNYIVVPFDGGFDGGVKEFTFTVDQPVKVYVHSSASAMKVTDTVSDDAWTASQRVVTRRFQNVLDHLSCAYMLKKGYVNESNIVLDGKVGSSNGVRFNRYDVYESLKADCGTYVGWAIDPAKVEATGFTNSINDYRYEEYLEAWVD